MNIEEFPEDSDSSDEDYVPTGKTEDVPSEVDSDGDSEEPLSGSEENLSQGKKRGKKNTKKRKKQKTETSAPVVGTVEEKQEKTEEEKKQDIDDIWADFMKDTGFQSKSTVGKNQSQLKPETKPTEQKNLTQKDEDKKQTDKVKVTQIFEFAGEEVRVEKEVAANSAEARLLAQPSSECSKSRKVKGGGLSGIGNVLSQLGKKQKISTLEKTKLDWDRFKKEEKIEEELDTYNKGKNGYLERQDFLQRADLRRFEIEKEARSIERSKRLNNL